MRMNTPRTQPSASTRAPSRVRRGLTNGFDGVLIRAVAHELRDPLHAMDNALTVLERDAADARLSSGARARLMEGMRDAVTTMSRTCDDLLDIERHSLGMLLPELHVGDLAEVVRQAVERTATAPDRIDLDLEPVVVPLDAAMVDRIVANLLQNAERYTPDGSRVTVRVAPDAGGALLEVGDEGPGVPDAERATIFEPFQRGREGRGLGIGLSLVASFAEAHGGRTWVDARDGGGSVFRVLFPGDFEGVSEDTA
jgi:two-component system, OmpR family, sensor histidine kinase KdpD